MAEKKFYRRRFRDDRSGVSGAVTAMMIIMIISAFISLILFASPMELCISLTSTISGAPLVDLVDTGDDFVTPDLEYDSGPHGDVNDIQSSIGLANKMKVADEESG